MFNPVEPRLLATANSKEGVGLWDIRKPRRWDGNLSRKHTFNCYLTVFFQRSKETLKGAEHFSEQLSHLHTLTWLFQETYTVFLRVWVSNFDTDDCSSLDVRQRVSMQSGSSVRPLYFHPEAFVVLCHPLCHLFQLFSSDHCLSCALIYYGQHSHAIVPFLLSLTYAYIMLYICSLHDKSNC